MTSQVTSNEVKHLQVNGKGMLFRFLLIKTAIKRHQALNWSVWSERTAAVHQFGHEELINTSNLLHA